VLGGTEALGTWKMAPQSERRPTTTKRRTGFEPATSSLGSWRSTN
jgi:hypothetical protein